MSDDSDAGAGSGQGLGTMDRPSAADDRAVLAGVIWTIYDDLDAVSALRFELFVPVAADAGAQLQDFLELWGPAWADIAATRDAVVDEVLHANVEQLRAVGLTGPQLAMKVAGWRYGRARMVSAFDEGVDVSNVAVPLELGGAAPPRGVVTEARRVELRRPGLLRQLGRVIADSFGFSDTVLSTLAGVVALSEPLREGKEFMERVAGTVAEGVPG